MLCSQGENRPGAGVGGARLSGVPSLTWQLRPAHSEAGVTQLPRNWVSALPTPPPQQDIYSMGLQAHAGGPASAERGRDLSFPNITP